MDKDKIELKTVMESAAVAEYLIALAKGFKSGRLTIEKDGESLSLAPAEMAEVEVEARVKKDKARFSLEVSWRLMGVEDDPGSLKISAEAPKSDAPKPAAAKAQAKPEKKTEMKPEAPADAPMVKVIAAAPGVKPAAPASPAAATSSASGVKPAVPGAAASAAVKTDHKAAPKA